MSRKKGAAVAIIAVIAAVGGLVAYANMTRQEESSPAPVLTTIDRSDGPPENESTTIAEAPAEEQPANANGTVVANNNNNTVIESNTIVINKPVYRNNTIIYQPVTINLENYKTIINNQQMEVEDGDPDEPADTSHSITVNAKRIRSEGWSARFTDDKVGMYTAVYDISGNMIKAGYADERGFMVRGLEDRLYFVFPADCTDCDGKNDIMFRQWEDGSKDRPRLVPADSEVTASYRLVVPEKPKVVPITPPPGEAPPQTEEEPQPNETGTAAEPEITLKAQNATFVYGWVQVTAQVENKVAGFDDITIIVFRPDGTIHDSFSYSDQTGFFASREAGEGDYRVVATYEYDNRTAEAEILHPIKFSTPEFANLSATAADNNNTVSLNGMLRGGIAGENVTVAVRAPGGEELKKYSLSFGTKPVFTLFIPTGDVDAMFNSTGNYTFAVTHVQSGVTGNATLFYDANATETAAATPQNVSENSGRSDEAAVAAQGSNVYLVWVDDASSQHEILFAKSGDAGETFSEPVTMGQLEEGGFARNPDIAVSGNNVYVVWADYDSEEESTAAFVMSDDAGETFGNKTVFGNHSGEGADPRIALFGGDIYVSWITGAEEEFTGNLMLARSSNGVEFEAAPVTDDADSVSMASTDDSLYLTWLHYPTGDSSEESLSVVARSGNGVDFETTEGPGGIAVTSLAASGDSIYVAGFSNGTVIFAKSINGSAFNATEISSGTRASLAASGDSVYLAWEHDDEIFFASSSDGGETFGDAKNISNSEEVISYWPDVAAAENTYVTWTEGTSESTDIMIEIP